jgi:leader peptidase (prepilin peptidase) / N-methyltransferase
MAMTESVAAGSPPSAPRVALSRTTLQRRAGNRAELVVVGFLIAITTTGSLLMVPGVRGMLGGGLASIMIVIAAVDRRRYIIPDTLTLAALAVGLVYASVNAPDAIAAELVSALFRGVALASGFLALRMVYRRVRRREGIGLGDVKLAGTAGVWVDWMTIPVVIEVAAAAALTSYLVSRFVRQPGEIKWRLRSSDRLPFGLFFAPAIWLGWLIDAWIAAAL